jgi:hypothetical protein
MGMAEDQFSDKKIMDGYQVHAMDRMTISATVQQIKDKHNLQSQLAISKLSVSLYSGTVHHCHLLCSLQKHTS